MSHQLAVYVDWDHDAFICDQATQTDAPNRILTPVIWTGLSFMPKLNATYNILAETTPYGLYIVDTAFRLGNTSGLIIGQNANPATEIPVSPSTNYSIALWAKGLESYVGVLFTLDVRDQNDNAISSTITTLSNQWGQKTLNFTTGADDTAILIRFYKSNSIAQPRLALTGFMLVEGNSIPSAFNAGELSLYDNISTHVQSAVWERGRPPEHIDAIMPAPSPATVRLLNKSRIFSPDNASSPLYGALKAGRRLRIDLENSNTTTLWHGWLQRLEVGISQYAEPFTVLHADSGLQRLQRGPASLDVQYNKRADEIFALALSQVIAAPTAQHYWLLDSPTHSALGRSTVLHDLSQQLNSESGASQFSYIGNDWEADSTVWDLIKAVFEAERAVFYQSRQGELMFRNRHFWAQNSSSQYSANLDTDAHSAHYAYSDPANVVKVTCYPREIDPAINVLWSQQSPTRVGSGQILVLNVAVTSPDGVQMNPYTLIRPVAGLDYVAVDTHDSTTPRTELISVTVSNKGTSIELSIRNPSHYHVRLTTLRVRGSTLNLFNAVTLEASDLESIRDYGKFQLDLFLDALDNIATARDYAYFLLHERRQPRPILSRLAVVGAENVLLWDFGTRLSLSEYQTGLSADYFVVGERLAWQAPDMLAGELTLMPAASLMFWKLGTDALDISTLLGY